MIGMFLGCQRMRKPGVEWDEEMGGGSGLVEWE